MKDIDESYSDGELVTMLRDCNRKHGTVTVDVFAKDPQYCPAEVVRRRFGTWKCAKQEAEIDTTYSHHRHQYTTTQILSHLRELDRRNGDVTPGLLNSHDDLVPTRVVVDEFGSWQAAVDKAAISQ